MNVIVTGGGSGGHAFPAIAMAERAAQTGHRPLYLGSADGIERRLAETAHIPFQPIPVGKLRRYWSLNNFIDPLRVLAGIFKAWKILRRLPRRETIVYSFGGFVGLPVVIAAFLARRRSVLHEQTSRAGLANRLSTPFVSRIFLSFQSSSPFYPKSKTVYSGYPLREDFHRTPQIPPIIQNGTLRLDGRALLLVTGGGNGSRLINQWVADHRQRIPEQWMVLHLTGKDLYEEHRAHASPRYLPVPAIFEGMADLMRLSKAIIARGGAGTVSEIAFLRKPSIIVPLAIAQRNEQYHNALEASKRSPMRILPETALKTTDLWVELETLLNLPIPNESNQIPCEDPLGILSKELR